MGYPLPPHYWPPPRPPRSSADLTISIIAMVVTALTVGAGSLMGVFSLAFLDYCPPETCSTDGAVNASMTAVGIAVLVGLVGIATTVVRLTTRKRAWPFAVGTWVLCVLVFSCGAVAYTAAVS